MRRRYDPFMFIGARSIPLGPDPSVISNSVAVAAASTPGISVNVPPGTVDGHLMYLYVHVTAAAGVINAPVGWVPVFENVKPASSTSSTASLFQRIANAEPANYIVTTTNGRQTAAIVTVDNAAIPDDATANSGAAVADVNGIAPSVLASTPTLLLSFLSGRIPTVGVGCTWTADPSETDVVNAASVVAAVSNSTMHVGSQFVAAGATGTRTAVASVAVDWVAMSVAVNRV